jgi:hypothetical protein
MHTSTILSNASNAQHCPCFTPAYLTKNLRGPPAACDDTIEFETEVSGHTAGAPPCSGYNTRFNEPKLGAAVTNCTAQTLIFIHELLQGKDLFGYRDWGLDVDALPGAPMPHRGYIT